MSLKSWLIAIPCTLILWAVMFGMFTVGTGRADVGIAHGIGPHLSNPLTPHIGRLYYKSGKDGHLLSDAKHAADERYELPNAVCKYLHARYMARHGITTPRPLKGIHGCAKYEHDQNYWDQRRYHVPTKHTVNPLKKELDNIKQNVLSFDGTL